MISQSSVKLVGFGKQANGCELPVLGPQAQVSGRGSFPHMLFQELGS
jgi:hypothetical protein